MNSKIIVPQKTGMLLYLSFIEENTPCLRQSETATKLLLEQHEERVFKEVTENFVQFSGAEARGYRYWFCSQFRRIIKWNYLTAATAWKVREVGVVDRFYRLFRPVIEALDEGSQELAEIFGSAKDKKSQRAKVASFMELSKMFLESSFRLFDFIERSYETTRTARFMGLRPEDYISKDLDREKEAQFFGKLFGMGPFKGETGPLMAWYFDLMTACSAFRREVETNFDRLSFSTTRPYLEQLLDSLKMAKQVWLKEAYERVYMPIPEAESQQPQRLYWEEVTDNENAPRFVCMLVDIVVETVEEKYWKQETEPYEFDVLDPDILTDDQYLVYWLNEYDLLPLYKTAPKEVFRNLEDNFGYTAEDVSPVLGRLSDEDAWTAQDHENLRLVEQYVSRTRYLPAYDRPE